MSLQALAQTTVTSGVLQTYFEPIKIVKPIAPAFEVNTGEFDPAVKYFSRQHDYCLLLAADKIILAMRRMDKLGDYKEATLVMRFVGANEYPLISASDSFFEPVTYYLGKEEPRLVEKPGFKLVKYLGVFPGIDVSFRANPDFLEYFFELAPNADLHDIVMDFSGATSLALGERGELIIQTAAGALVRPVPEFYQVEGNERTRMAGGYTLLSDTRVGFEASGYNRMAALVVDPVLVFMDAQLNWSDIPLRRIPALSLLGQN